MLDIHLVGTGGTMPLPKRALTSLIVRYNGSSLLIDCGEGTQVALQEQGLSMNPIDMILFTHFHADHILGLPGLLLSMGKQGRTEAVTLVGPVGLHEVVKSLLVVAGGLPFPIKILEIEKDEGSFTFNDLKITFFAVEHSVRCFGFSINLPRIGKFDAEKARALGLPVQVWSKLQRGETIELDGAVFTPDMVLGAPRKGLKVTYVTDSRPTPRIVEQAQSSDLLICEGMYAEDEKLDKAIEKQHMLFSEAAQIAKSAAVRRLWLTHYSPSLNNPEDYLPIVRSIFPETQAPLYSMSVTLNFED